MDIISDDRFDVKGVKKFNNRNLRRATRLWIDELRPGSNPGPLHFHFRARGKDIVYAYIRKNAASAFKRMLFDLVGKSSTSPDGNLLGILLQSSRANFHNHFLRSDKTMFVHRDPVRRMVSLYKDKFIRARGAENIHADLKEKTNLNPSTVTFEEFVFKYLPHGTDWHLKPQRSHLFPGVYTDAIPIEHLTEAMAGILPSALAEKHFGEKTNATGGDIQHLPDAAKIGAHELRQDYKRNRSFPSRESFAPTGGAVHGSIMQKYEVDNIFVRS